MGSKGKSVLESLLVPSGPMRSTSPTGTGEGASSSLQIVVARPAVARTVRPLAYIGTEQYVVRSRLKLRSGPELNSTVIGGLPTTAFVSVVEVARTDEGIMRAKVVECSATGEKSKGKEGWVSYIGKDGRSNLIPFHWTRFQRKRETAAPVAKAEEEPTKTTAAASLDTAIAALTFSRKLKRRALETAARKAQTLLPIEEAPPPPIVDAIKEAELEEAKALAKFKVQTSAEVEQIVLQFKNEQEAEEIKLKATHSGLKVKLGEELFKTRVKISDLVKSFAIKAEITKMDFRKHVRKVITWENVKDIDALFAEIDADHGGTLDVEELTAAMKDLQSEAKRANGQDQEIKQHIDFLLSRVEVCSRVLKLTQDAESHEEAFEKTKGSRSTEAQLGYELLKRSTKITDLVSAWESTNGEMDKVQFRSNVRAFGVDDDDTGLDKVFDSLDLDFNGTLDLGEIRKALEVWKTATYESDRKMVVLKKGTAEKWKVVKLAQMDLQRVLKEDQLKAKAEEEAAAKALEEQEEASKEAKMKEESRLKAIKKKKEEEQRAYDEKIEARRRAEKDKSSEEARQQGQAGGGSPPSFRKGKQ